MASARPPLFVDLSTAYAERGRIAHGTVRVERELIGALATLAGTTRPDLAFCRFDQTAHRFVAVSREEALAVVRAPTEPERRRAPRPAWRSHPLLQVGRRVERFVRTEIRDRFRRFRAALREGAARPVASRPADSSARGATGGATSCLPAGARLLVPGELQRHDFGHLIALKRQHRLALALLFYDLLGTLPPGDPRLDDPDAADIPSSEFVLRHADRVLAISAFSASALASHAKTRGVAGPPVSVIRLGHRLAAADAPPPTPVEGLAPGGFVLTVGDVGTRKNHRLLLDVWASLARDGLARPGTENLPVLVVAGRVGHEGAALVAAAERDPVLRDTVRFLSNVDDQALRWLYAHCRFTLFPSLSEGFGLPVVESLAAGKACIASNATAIPEASQGAAIHLDPHDGAAWRAEVLRLLDDDALAAAEAEIAKKFRMVSWDDTAADVLLALDAERWSR
ncbi:glycosyl transferase, group 1 [Rhodovulum sp. PH10]|uniref:glycosyltransferase n=1 Tax=Rhodovulum sp. PH10 TaxID=1187851 RepID=UPI00027C275B|nr:glycosyltransferase [Rhodovulum sp. PH10]EJW13021.1 glycosyl transferase, group 1 [Rhodovulum sp. PH10]